MFSVQLLSRVHAGNLLLDRDGHIMHIDFGFVLSNNPGGVSFERAPFKLTKEFVQLMGGTRSSTFKAYRKLVVQAFLATRKHREKIILLVEMMYEGNEHLPCFAGGRKAVVDGLQQRFFPKSNTMQVVQKVHRLIDESTNNWRTRWYDKYQRCCVGIF